MSSEPQSDVNFNPSSSTPPVHGGAGRDAVEQERLDTQTASSESIWAKAKERFSGVSSQVTNAGTLAAAKAAQIGTPVIAKAVAVGTQTYGVTIETARGALESGRQVYEDSKLESAVNFIDGELEQRGAKQAFVSTAGAVVDKLDQVTGKRLLELLEERLRRQDAYNDILATRLAEALERIAKLEARTGDA
ncbi:MAG TPA: hypothetical protein VGN12_18495 [Pirellulales bacterium]|jgi:hypothetical protein